MLSSFIKLPTTWEKPDKVFSQIPLESKGEEEEEIPYKESQTIWSYCNKKDQYL